MPATNKEGLSYYEWLKAAGVTSSKEHYDAWYNGEDPSEYRKDNK